MHEPAASVALQAKLTHTQRVLAVRSLGSVLIALMVAAVLGAVSCGGSTEGGANGGGANAGGASTGGTGATSTGGSGATNAGCTGTPPDCVPSYCGGDVVFSASCVDGAWACTPDYVLRDECPPDACFTVPSFCCDALGNPLKATCPGQGAPVCAPGTTPMPFGGSCAKPVGCEVSSCDAGELCVFADHQCGAGQPGSCVAKPQICDDVLEPVCGCDGVIYGNACSAQQAGVDLGVYCTPPAGSELCGTHVCELGVEYCEVGTGEKTFACKALPAGCAPSPSCACLSGEPCSAQCSGGAGFLKLSCE